MSAPNPASADGAPAGRVLERNIETLLARARERRAAAPWQERLALRIAGFTGSMTFVWIHLALFSAWIVVNLGWTPLTPFDASFTVLAMAASVEAIFLSTFVLIMQNQAAREADRRSELNVQISLLAEHETTELIKLVSELAEKFGVSAVDRGKLDELKQDVRPEEVLDKIEDVQSAPGE